MDQPGSPETRNTSQVGCRNFGEGLKRFGKQVQGAMPIVGLFSRLAAPDGGGFEEQVWHLHLPGHCSEFSYPSEDFVLAGLQPQTCKDVVESTRQNCIMQTYPEYCRAQLEEGSVKLNCAAADLNAVKGAVCYQLHI